MIFSIECPGLHFATANFWADIVNLQLTPSVNVIWHLKFFTNCEKLKLDHKFSLIKRTQSLIYLSPPKVFATEDVMREVQEPTTPREQLELHAAGVTVRL